MYDLDEMERIINEGGTSKYMLRVQLAKPDHYKASFFRWFISKSAHTSKLMLGLLTVWFILYFRFYRTTVNDA